MDPVTALGIAAAVAQFIQFGSSLASQASRIYRSSDGALLENIECESQSRRLKDLCEGMRNSSGEALKEVCEGCLEVAGELQELLRKLQLEERAGESSARRKWRSFREALMSVCSAKDIERLKNRLAGFRDELETHLIMTLKDQTSAITTAQRDSFAALQDLASDIKHKPHLVKNDLDEQREALVQANLNEHEKTRATIISEKSDEKSKQLEASYLRSLRFLEMRDRHETVAEAHKATFRWIFEGADAYAHPWSNFVDWLHHGDGVYWINGKAASGKSTLMRFIIENPMTIGHLKQWSNTEALQVAAFFFWNSGSLEQRSYTGLLSSLLYEVLNKHRKLIRLVFPLEWTEDFGQMTQWDSPDRKWSLSALKKAFSRLTTFDIAPLKLCFFIDGLDEYEGDHEEMAELLKQVALSPHVKFCLSSRPWIIFEEAFQGLPTLRLQDLTAQDIKAYVADKLERHSQMHKLSQNEPERASELVTEIVTKASGVFLWVVLVVRDLLRGLRNRDDISDLQKRLKALPSELEELYTHMLGHVDPLYQEQASRTFQIFRILSDSKDREPIPLTPAFFDGAITSTQETAISAKLEPMSKEEAEKKYQNLDRHLKSRCEGLLEIHSFRKEFNIRQEPYYSVIPNGSVNYLHRTVRDFLESEPVKTRMVQHTARTDFDPNVSIMMALIIRLKQFLFHPELLTEAETDVPMKNLAREISLILSFARAAEKGKSKYVELLDESDRVATYWAQNIPYGGSLPHWSYHCKQQQHQGAGFLSEAVRFGLFPYVSTKLEADSGILLQSKANNALITHALIPMQRSFSEGVVYPPEMVELLVKHGADPNRLFWGNTPWQRFLTWTHNNSRNYAQHLYLWSSLFRTMLLSGASTTATCTKNHKLHNGTFSSRHRVFDVIDDIFGSSLPDDALALKQLVEALQKDFDKRKILIPDPTLSQLRERGE